MAKCVCICLGGFVVAQGNLYHPVTATVHCLAVYCSLLDSFHCELHDIKLSMLPCYFFLINRFSGGGSLGWDWASGTKAWLLEHWMNRSGSLVKSFTGTHLQKQSRRSLAWIKKGQGSLFCISASWTRAQHAWEDSHLHCPIKGLLLGITTLAPKSPNPYRTAWHCHQSVSCY